MTLIIMLMLTLAAGWFQIWFPPLAAMGYARPPLLAAVVVFYAVRFPGYAMATAVVICGVIYDSNSVLPLGVSVLYYCAAGVLIQRHKALWNEGGGLVAAILTGLTAVFQPVLFFMAGALIPNGAEGVPGGWMRHLFFTGVFSVPAWVAIAYAANRLHRMTGTVEEPVHP